MHALLVLLAFTLAAVVTYAVVVGLLILAERRWHADEPADDVPDDLADVDDPADRPTGRPRAHC